MIDNLNFEELIKHLKIVRVDGQIKYYDYESLLDYFTGDNNEIDFAVVMSLVSNSIEIVKTLEEFNYMSDEKTTQETINRILDKQ